MAHRAAVSSDQAQAGRANVKPRWSRRRKIVFAVITIGLSAVLALGVLLAADLYAHQKFQESGAVNIWGYRGPTVGGKRAGERRVVVLGGSTALGYGVRWHEAFPAQLESLLKRSDTSAASSSAVSVVNLAYNGEGAHSFRFTLEDYEYLDYDLALFYTGYNDLAYLNNFQVSNRQVMRRQSALYRWTGYFPMLPLVMREKAMAIRYDGRLDDAYQGRSTVFRPNLAQRSTATALEAAAGLSESLDRLMAETKRSPGEAGDGQAVLADPASVECGVYTGYCGEVYLAVKLVLDRGKRAIVVTQPYINPGHQEQQRLLVEYLRKRLSGSTQLAFVNLGLSVDLLDPALAPDGMHLSAAGNLIIAQGLVTIVRATLDGSVVDPVAPAVPPTSVVGMTPVVSVARTASGPAPGALRISAVDARPMAWIPLGTFEMGSPLSEADRNADETPHLAIIGAGFWMDTSEVTIAAYERFRLNQAREWSISWLSTETYDGTYLRGWDQLHEQPPQGKGDHPVTAVPWAAARAYCTWAGKRLPTEAEWEYAARAGTTTAYWWGDAFDATRANRNGTGTEPVGHASRVNPWGLADMVGNVWEWTSSRYQPYPNRAEDEREDPEPGGDRRRVLRGGAWVIGPAYLRSADRFKYTPRIASDYVGFRCVLSGS